MLFEKLESRPRTRDLVASNLVLGLLILTEIFIPIYLGLHIVVGVAKLEFLLSLCHFLLLSAD